MPGAPSFIALDWGTSSLRAWRFGESPNPQEKREFPWGIMKLLCMVIFFPVILIGMVVGGLMYIAFPLLIIGGIIGLVMSRL